MEELERLYLEISVLSSMNFSAKIRCLIGAVFNPYSTLEEIRKVSLVKDLLAAGIEEKTILRILEDPNRDFMLVGLKLML